MRLLRNATLTLASLALLAGAVQIATPDPVKADGDPCEMRCRHRAHEQYRRCVDEGGEPERCSRRARESYRRCVREHCRG